MKTKRIGPMRESQTMPSMPCYFRTLLTAGVIDRNTSLNEAFDLFMALRLQPEVQAAYEKVEKQKSTKRVQIPAFFALNIAAMELLSKEELQRIALRLLYQTKNESVREFR